MLPIAILYIIKQFSVFVDKRSLVRNMMIEALILLILPRFPYVSIQFLLNFLQTDVNLSPRPRTSNFSSNDKKIFRFCSLLSGDLWSRVYFRIIKYSEKRLPCRRIDQYLPCNWSEFHFKITQLILHRSHCFPRACNWFADHNEWPNRNTIIRRFLFPLNSSVQYHWTGNY